MTTVNQYARQAMRYCAAVIPDRLAALPDPDRYFQTLGEEIQTQITDLAIELAGPDRPGEHYREKAARLVTARTRAEEIVMAQLVWEQDPVLPLTEAREEWDQTTASEEGLIAWAERIQDSPDPRASLDDLEEMSARWALPIAFLEDLITTEPPREHLARNRALLDEARTIRFLRELH